MRSNFCSHSSNRSGRLSRALGSRKPCSTSVMLAAVVAGEHPPDLRARSRAIRPGSAGCPAGKKSSKRVGRLARLAAREVAGVVLDPGTVAHLQQHLHVVPGPGRQPLGLQQLALLLELLQPLLSSLPIASTAPWMRSSGSTKCLAG